MDKHPTVSYGNPLAVLLAVLTVTGIKYGYVSSSDWNILAYISAPMFFISLVVFRRKPPLPKTKPITRIPTARRSREEDTHTWI